jgi:hypothetical protein
MANASHADWSKLFTLASAVASNPAETDDFLDLLLRARPSLDQARSQSGEWGRFDRLAVQVRNALRTLAVDRAPTGEDLVGLVHRLRASDDDFARAFADALDRELESPRPERGQIERPPARASAAFFKKMLAG